MRGSSASKEVSGYLGKTTNNVAEYRGLVEGVRALSSVVSRGDRVEIAGDSQLVIQQVRGSWKCNYDHLRVLRDEARGELRRLEERGVRVELRHIPRASNAHADSLASRAADNGRRAGTG